MKSTLKHLVTLGALTSGWFIFPGSAISQNQDKAPVCSQNKSPYTDFDFVLGTWDFVTPDGKKIGEQIYTKREKGCLVMEEWKLATGGTGTGMSFVDPETGKWRQVWMSPMFHIDYSGGINDDGAMELEGIIYPNDGRPSSPVRGIWAKQPDGSVRQEFRVFNKQTKTWEMLFAGSAVNKR